MPAGDFEIRRETGLQGHTRKRGGHFLALIFGWRTDIDVVDLDLRSCRLLFLRSTLRAEERCGKYQQQGYARGDHAEDCIKYNRAHGEPASSLRNAIAAGR